ncbi:4824_t:CDS:2 [Racocetra fulgida]|uniref:4824_t:CDS:1 n=1 Tax=Racocetra fulgida TaxID=60492 RepID=A0A9N8W0W6_9GLOM|nr:4824_t:CDS:2 [Racocetra fulgida]
MLPGYNRNECQENEFLNYAEVYEIEITDFKLSNDLILQYLQARLNDF